MARRGEERRNGTKLGRRKVEELRPYYDAGVQKGLRMGWWRGVVVGAVAVALVETGLLLALGILG